MSPGSTSGHRLICTYDLHRIGPPMWHTSAAAAVPWPWHVATASRAGVTHRATPTCKCNLRPPPTRGYTKPHLGIASHVYTSAASSLRMRRIEIARNMTPGHSNQSI